MVGFEVVGVVVVVGPGYSVPVPPLPVPPFVVVPSVVVPVEGGVTITEETGGVTITEETGGVTITEETGGVTITEETGGVITEETGGATSLGSQVLEPWEAFVQQIASFTAVGNVPQVGQVPALAW